MNRNFFCAFISILLTGSLAAQTFELTENKGQWNKAVLFKGELSAGAFFLKDNGYRVLQHHPEDYATAIEYLAGKHVYVNETNKEKRSVVDIKDPGQGSSNGTELEAAPSVRSHSYDVIFEGSNPSVKIFPEKEMQGYSNYYIGSDSTKWKSGVKSYGTLRYAGLYNGVDAIFYSEAGYLKYDLVVKPNANVAAIVLRYDSAGITRLKNGDLLIKTSVNEVVEKVPYVYQLVNGVRKQVSCEYVVRGNRVSFKLGEYNKNEVLVIDPTLVFSTFSGSTADNWGYTATYDGFGNAYGGGIVFGSGWPTTPGAFQTVFGGGTPDNSDQTGYDIGITKFNPRGTARIFSTYLGGSNNEQPHSLVVDGLGNLIVSGRTTSSANFPVTAGGKIGVGGGWDIIVTKFNASGTALLGSVQIGGTLDDGVNIKHKTASPTGPLRLYQNYGDDARSEVLADKSGNIYVASCTRSTNFPTTPGVFQSVLGGEQDALVLKFTPNMALSFATLMGGSADDAAYVLYIDDDNTLLVAGGTASADFPGDKTNTVGPSFTPTTPPNTGFTCDGFIAKIRNDGSAIIKSMYIGTSGIDQVYGIQEDRNGFVYVMGTNTGMSGTNFPIRNAAYGQVGGKQFIAKLQPDFSAYVYSTVFGTNSAYPNISPTAFLVDRCENVYVSGWGGRMGESYQSSGTASLPITPDAIDNNTDGKDFYFFVLEKDATRQLYGTFFGQQDPPNSGTPDHVDGGTSRFDPQGVIYQGICANCSPGQFPTTPGVVAPSKPSSALCNLAVIKINFDLSGVAGGIKSSIDGVDGDTSACAPALVNFRDTIGIAQTYQWSFGDGSPELTTTVPEASYTYSVSGTYRVRLIAVDLTRCFPRDTSYVNIRVRTDRVTVSALANKLDPCQSNTYRFDNVSTIIPAKPFSDTSFTWIFGDNSNPVKANRNSVTHQFPAAGTYTVKLILTDTNYCNAPDSFTMTLRVSPQVDAAFEVHSPGCAPYQAVFNNTSAGGQTFQWDFGNGQTSTAINPTTLYPTPGTYTIRLIAQDPTTCNLVDTTFKTIEVLSKPIASFSFSPNPSEENIPTTFTNLSQPAVKYKWIFGDGDSLVTISRDTLVKHQYNTTGTYNVCLITFNDIGCNDTLCRPIEALVDPMIDVVTAFTPNNDGKNDRAVIIGFGVIKLNFKIFNRWGEMMFETNDVRFGWDGKYKGKPQPMDAYGYTIEAELLSGQTIRKSGSITLIR